MVVATGVSVLFIWVLPRRPAGIARVSLWVNRAVRLVFVGFTRLARSYEAKDAILAPVGPVALVVQLLVWATGFIVGFGLMLQPTTHDLADGLLQALGSVFTVGAIHPGGAENLPLDVAAGALWVVVVALQIAYLPALYAAFSQREGLVAKLETGRVPAWGPELLARHQLVGIIDTLPELYSASEWSAEVAESHTTYPVLLLFRSPEPWFSWLLALLAVLDGAAMHLSLSPATASSNARLCLRMGFTALDRIGSMLGWHLNPDPLPEAPIQLSFTEFEEAVRMLAEVGFPIERTAEEAWPDFHGWRVNYETAAYRLADRLVRRRRRGPDLAATSARISSSRAARRTAAPSGPPKPSHPGPSSRIGSPEIHPWGHRGSGQAPRVPAIPLGPSGTALVTSDGGGLAGVLGGGLFVQFSSIGGRVGGSPGSPATKPPSSPSTDSPESSPPRPHPSQSAPWSSTALAYARQQLDQAATWEQVSRSADFTEPYPATFPTDREASSVGLA